jgi:hypothetical protein
MPRQHGGRQPVTARHDAVQSSKSVVKDNSKGEPVVKGVSRKVLLSAGMLFAVLLTIGVMNTGRIVAQTPDPTVPTEATVTGSGVAPLIECKWELPDMQPGVTDATFPDGTIQYGKALGSPPVPANAHIHDDDMNVAPDADNNAANGTQVPCDVAAQAPGFPTMPEFVRHMIQVKPNAEDKPEERRIQLWMAVDHPNGVSNISDVYWKIFHPDGSFKVQVHGTRVPVANCSQLGDSATVGTMFEAAYHTGQITALAINDPNRGLKAKCSQNEKAIYYATFTLSKHQPCGEYRVEAHAVSSGLEDTLTNFLDVLCYINMELDFNRVNYGTITPGLTKVVSGDFLFNPPSDTFPTAKNTANGGLGIAVIFSEMKQSIGGTPIAGAKIIDQFDICFVEATAFAADNTSLKCIDPVMANTRVELGTARAQTLCANEVGKIDFSIHPPSTLPAGTYTGTVTIIAVENPDVCPGDQREILPPPPPPSV